MNKSENLELIIELLEKSTTEEDIMDNLMKIIKGFNIDLYKDRILSNPYFKSLVPDVKDNIYKEIEYYRESIKGEIIEIEKELTKSENENSNKLKSLKRDCISLLYEIDQREKDIRNL